MYRGMTALPKQTDVFVIGGGPAGLAAAIAARQRGFQVVVADGAGPFAIDKACGEGLMPDSVAALRVLGIEVPERGNYPFHGIRFAGANASVEARFGEGCGLGVRRTRLHELMVKRALEAGVSIYWNAPVSAILPGGVNLQDQTVACRWIAGADGATSAVRRCARLAKG